MVTSRHAASPCAQGSLRTPPAYSSGVDPAWLGAVVGVASILLVSALTPKGALPKPTQLLLPPKPTARESTRAVASALAETGAHHMKVEADKRVACKYGSPMQFRFWGVYVERGRRNLPVAATANVSPSGIALELRPTPWPALLGSGRRTAAEYRLALGQLAGNIEDRYTHAS